jgi:hypothetical protein
MRRYYFTKSGKCFAWLLGEKANQFKHVCLGTGFAHISAKLLTKVAPIVGDKIKKNRLRSFRPGTYSFASSTWTGVPYDKGGKVSRHLSLWLDL